MRDYEASHRRRRALSWPTCTPKNRVWSFENTPSGRPVVGPQLTQETATGSVQYTYQIASGRAEWLSRDPLPDAEMSQGPNLYDYTGNNPIDRIDPLGLMFGAIPIVGTIEQGWNTYFNNVNGMNSSDYTAHPELGQAACEADIDNQAFWKTASYVLPNGERLGVDIAGTIITTYALTPITGAVVGGVSAIDTLSGTAIAFTGAQKIKNAANAAKSKCCQGN